MSECIYDLGISTHLFLALCDGHAVCDCSFCCQFLMLKVSTDVQLKCFSLQDAGGHTTLLSFRSDLFVFFVNVYFCYALFLAFLIYSFLYALCLLSLTKKIITATERSQYLFLLYDQSV